jgi:hypothetical protein
MFDSNSQVKNNFFTKIFFQPRFRLKNADYLAIVYDGRI